MPKNGRPNDRLAKKIKSKPPDRHRNSNSG
jgi:hypothetical protein